MKKKKHRKKKEMILATCYLTIIFLGKSLFGLQKQFQALKGCQSLCILQLQNLLKRMYGLTSRNKTAPEN